jgi:hypothetical protein
MLYEALGGRLAEAGNIVSAYESRLAIPALPRSVHDRAPDLATLCEQMLALRPSERPTAEDVLTTLGVAARPTRTSLEPVSETPFMGRQPELARLAAALSDALAGRPRTVLVSGTSGLGKTTLVRRFLRSAKRELDAITLASRCYERESVPYKAFDQIVDALARELHREPIADALAPDEAAALARLFPPLARALRVSPAEQTRDPATLRRRAFSAFCKLLGSIASRRPLVIFVDDLQWGDPESAALLEAAQTDVVGPVLWIFAFREDVAADVACVAVVERAQAVDRIALVPLSFETTVRLATELLAGAAPDLSRRIAREADGNPFLVTELARDTLEREDLDVLGSQLERMLARRLDALPREAREILELAAIAGRPTPPALLLRAARTGEAGERALVLLRSAHLIRSRSASLHEALVEPYHDRLRDAIVAPLDGPRRAALHGSLAATFASSPQIDAEWVAAHYELAGQTTRARELVVRAARDARAALAFERAARLFGRAIEMTPDEGPQRFELLTSRADALSCAGRGYEAGRGYLVAASKAEPGAAHALRTRAAEQLLCAGHIADGLAVVEEILRDGGMSLPKSPNAALASFLFQRVRLKARGRRTSLRAIADVPPHVLRKLEACLTVTVGLTAVDMVRATDFASRALLLALEAGEPYLLARALTHETVFLSFAGESARRHAEDLLGLTEEVAAVAAHPRTDGLATYAKGSIECFAGGRWLRSAAAFERAHEIFRTRCQGVAWEIATSGVVLVWSYFWSGRLSAIARHSAGLVDDARARGDRYAEAMLSPGAVWSSLREDDPAGALSTVRRALEPWAGQPFCLQHLVGQLAECFTLRYNGDAKAAYLRFARDAEPLRRSMLLRVQNSRATALIEQAACALEYAREGGPRSLLAEASRCAERLETEASWTRPFAEWIRAALASFAGRPTEALEQLARARANFDAVDMKLHAAACLHELGVLKSDPRSVERAAAEFKVEGVARPDRWAQTLAPGLRRSREGRHAGE